MHSTSSCFKDTLLQQNCVLRLFRNGHHSCRFVQWAQSCMPISILYWYCRVDIGMHDALVSLLIKLYMILNHRYTLISNHWSSLTRFNKDPAAAQCQCCGSYAMSKYFRWNPAVSAIKLNFDPLLFSVFCSSVAAWTANKDHVYGILKMFQEKETNYIPTK